MNQEKLRKIPVMFQKLEHFETEDTRFQNVKIWLMHLQENLNGSYFSKEVVDEAIPTLANTPILAYVEDNSDGENDFSDHRQILVKENDQYKIKYIGQAIGVIPENNNAKFEMRLCDDGVEREFLVVEGLLWTKFDDPIDIMNRDSIKAQSMELHEDYEGKFEEDGLFYFSKFKFFGACALGKDIQPAMKNSTIELQFSYQDFQKEVQVKMEQFKQFSLQYQTSNDVKDIDINNQEGGTTTVNEKLELIKKYNLTQDQLNFSIDNLSIEELESKLKEFALTAEQFKDELINELRTEKIKDEWGWEYSRYSYVDYKDNVVFAYDRQDNWKLYGFEFNLNGDKVTINFESAKRKKFDIVDFEEGQVEVTFELFPQEAIDYAVNVKEKEVEKDFVSKQDDVVKAEVNEVQESFDAKETNEYKQLQEEFNTINSDFTSLKEEVEKLRKFQQDKLSEERKVAENALFEQFEKLNGIEEFEELKKKSAEFSLEDLEKEIALIYVKKNGNFSSKTKEKHIVKVELGNKDKDVELPYGDLFTKYGNK